MHDAAFSVAVGKTLARDAAQAPALLNRIDAGRAALPRDNRVDVQLGAGVCHRGHSDEGCIAASRAAGCTRMAAGSIPLPCWYTMEKHLRGYIDGCGSGAHPRGPLVRTRDCPVCWPRQVGLARSHYLGPRGYLCDDPPAGRNQRGRGRANAYERREALSPVFERRGIEYVASEVLQKVHNLRDWRMS